MHIGIAQINTVVGAFDQTVEHMVAQSMRAAEQGVELLVFPLPAFVGTEDLPLADGVSFLHDMVDALAVLAERLACPAIIPIPPTEGMSGTYCEAVAIEDGTLIPLDVEARVRDGAASAEAPEMVSFSHEGLRFVLALDYADLDALDEFDYEADVVIFTPEYPFAVDDPSSAMGADLGHGRYVGDAQATALWFVGVSAVGGYGDLVFPGASFVLSPTGELVASAPAFEEALLVAEVGARSEAGEGALADRLTLESFDEPFFLWQAVCVGIHDYVHKHGFSDVALCLDGSLSSMVLAALACDALGPRHVHVLVGQSAGSGAPACRELTRRLRVDQEDVRGPVREGRVRDVDEVALALLARRHSALVLSSLDKTALALGLRTAMTTAATLCPLGDVYRTDVLDMAHMRNTISPLFRRVAIGPVDTLVIPMPDGTELLVDNESLLCEVDEILLGFVEYDRPLSLLAADSDDEGTMLVDAVLHQVRTTELLRRCMPPVLVMSTRTLDDACFPLGVSWRDAHLEPMEESLHHVWDKVAALSGGQDKAASEKGQAREAHEALDLQGTLAMLRDLAEQGGFVPREGSGTGKATGGQGWPFPGMQASAEDMRWLAPFSEN